jgi:hypothetical protein
MLTAQQGSMQRQETGLREDYLFMSEIAGGQQLVCAWCLAEKGITANEGSHGICKRHANELILQWKEQRIERIKSRTEWGSQLANPPIRQKQD